ncbi:MAG: hypothetical protein RLZZ579_733 [Actinomycetota bacterium]
MKLGFILGETWQGIRANLSMALSIVLVTFISLTFVSVASLLQIQISSMKNYWYERAQVAIYLCTDYSADEVCASGTVTDEQKAEIEKQLQSTALAPYMDQYYFETHEQAYEKFAEEFADVAAAQYVTADQLNEAYWVNLKDPTQSDLLFESFSGQPGVEEVRDQRAYLDKIFSFLNMASLAAGAIATAMLLSAALLISNTIRLSAFSRRREISIMRLVGASSLSIQLPFILEGVIVASIGSLLAILASGWLVEYALGELLAQELALSNVVGLSDVLAIAPGLLALGVILATLASGISTRRYLRI